MSRAGRDAALVPAMCSLLLRYPDATLFGTLEELTTALTAVRSARTRQRLGAVTGWLAEAGERAACEHYVDTFDLRRRCSLHLSYYRHGDTRARGMALLALKHVYRTAGFEPPEQELPDYLPLMLEFTAAAPDAGDRLLVQCRAGLELLHRALAGADSPYAQVVDVVRDRLPTLPRSQRGELERLAASGPPTEQVGLEPFAPPEYVTGEAR